MYLQQPAKMPKIMRLTLFKLPDQELVKSAIEMYNSLAQDAKKDGKQYIKLAQANAAHEDDRSQGYTLMARCIFDSVDDMNYYDKEDEAHLKIKSQFKDKVTAPPLVLYTDYHGP
ncbi:stress responsive a b barrel domain-containing [Pyrenophora seminiperda CCB06]|uniref:Stress responsive a b barrel domain-containing n=1 Tax=Pyrenophora seminiperda CCB06 TaxID=1302712 RepID=A0A3M7MJC0_9PLEO|nr:stress responsive a b barrel domain-containing [Pyrenophora seminiperda CCB06]